MMKWAACIVAGLVFQTAAFGASGDGSVTHVFPAMRTIIEIAIPEDNGSDVPTGSLVAAAEALVHAAESLLGPKGEASDVRRLNATPAGTWVEVSPLTMRVVLAALRWHELSGGLFDPTIAPLKRLFRFNGKTLETWPSEADIVAARELVGADKLLVDTENCRLAWKIDGMSLDLGGIAKGFAADLVAEALLDAGVEYALINAGGEMRAIGRKPGDAARPWRVGIKDPRGEEPQFFVEVHDRAIATSGDYESYFEYEGKRHSHIIDPRTGLPVAERVAGATVSHPRSATSADALATIMCIMGAEKAERFFREHANDADLAGVEAVIFEVGEKERISVTHISVNHDGAVVAEKR